MDELRIPRENPNDDVVRITELHVSGEVSVSTGQELIEIETSKATIVLEAPRDGFLRVMVKKGDEKNVNDIYAVYLDGEPSYKTEETEVSKLDESTIQVVPTENQVLSDNAVQLIEEQGSQNVELTGNWITSRIIKGDLPLKKVTSEKNTVDSFDDHECPRRVTSILPHTIVKVNIRKRSEIKSLSIPGGGVFLSCLGIDIKGLIRVSPDYVFGSSIQDLVCYETGKLLSGSFKEMNSFYAGDNEIGLYNEVHAGISLDDGGRLTVAQISNINDLSLTELRSEMVGIYTRFEDNVLTSEDLNPSTFTISDLSNSGCGYVLPLINGAQSFIIGIIRNTVGFNLFISFDHRVTEGHQVAKFSEILRDRIESHFDELNRQEMSCDFCEKSLEEEVSLGNRGLIQLTTNDGTEHICWNCFHGW